MSPAFLRNVTRRQHVQVKVVFFSRKRIICKTNILKFVCTTVLYKFLKLLRNNVHNLSSYIHVQRKKTSGILSQHCVYIVYIANEGCHIRMLIYFLYIFLNKDGTWKVYKVSVTCQPVYSSLQLRFKWNDFYRININIYTFPV